MDVSVSVKGIDSEVVRRLAEQAEAEGVSSQEWMRQALRRTASLLTPSELTARAAARSPVTRERYTEVMGDLAAARASGIAEAVRTGVRRSGS
jgi:hypothetical protein